MFKEIKNFYNKIKIDKYQEDNEQSKIPITYIKVFHKTYPRFRSVKLDYVDKEESEFDILLDYRKSCRMFSDKALSFNKLSKILNSCRIINNIEGLEKRTYPSGGARFPVELYYISFNTEGLDKGAYHYNFKEKSLEQLLKKDFSKMEQRELISPYLENPAGSIFFSSVISRSEIKYGLRAYPYSLIESGHMGQNILLTSVKIGIGACPVSGFVDKKINKILDLLSTEIPIYSISLGNIKRK